MLKSRVLIIPTILILSSFRMNISVNSSGTSASVHQDDIGCFVDDLHHCLIQANLTLEETGNILPVNVDCTFFNETDTGQHEQPNSNDDEYSRQLGNLFLNRFKNIRNVSMNGRCANTPTFGLEHLPDTNRTVQRAIFYNFNIASLVAELFRNIGSVTELIFKDNHFENVSRNAFQNTKILKNISFIDNQLKRIEIGAFDDLQLEKLFIQELDLAIDEEEFFVNINCTELSLAVRSIDEKAFEKFNVNLKSLEITRMHFKDLKIQNPKNLEILTIVENMITTVTIIDRFALKWLNLSRNFLHDLKLINCSIIESLDLSHNLLTYIQENDFRQMTQLKSIDLNTNGLKTISLDIFEKSASNLMKIDVTSNLLRLIEIRSDFVANPDLKIIVNKNPWNCQWILNISRRLPELYRIFRYEKYVSKINVNGLECVAYTSTLDEDGDMVTLPPIIEGSNDEKNAVAPNRSDQAKRQQKNRQALYILLAIVSVLSIVSFLAYLWVKCRRVFRLSYYQSLKRNHWSPERFDVIRQFPADNSSDYEIPLEFINGHDRTEHCELLDTIGKFDSIEIPSDDIPEPVAIYEEIKERN